MAYHSCTEFREVEEAAEPSQHLEQTTSFFKSETVSICPSQMSLKSYCNDVSYKIY
jgi:hypothetical protein